jgi:catechol 2,3-dioxygenase-like lactoylglutathione lyase family enzyme
MTTDTRVTHLRHVAVGVQDYDKQVEFYEGNWGLRKTATDGDVSYFAAEGSPEQYIVRVRKSENNRVDLISFGVADAGAVDALASRLADEGVRFAAEPGTLQTPGGGYGFRFFDPDGRVVEISADVQQGPFRVLEPREDIPQKLSHVVIYSPEPQALMDFYQEKLGFKLSGWLQDYFGFLRCTPDFHSLAIVKGDARLHHISFELRGYDEYMRGVGRLLKTGLPMPFGIGKHTPADSTFAYFIDPNGNTNEYVAPQEMIIDDEAYVAPVWGRETPGDVWNTARSQNMPEDPSIGRHTEADRGLWVAPPV